MGRSVHSVFFFGEADVRSTYHKITNESDENGSDYVGHACPYTPSRSLLIHTRVLSLYACVFRIGVFRTGCTERKVAFLFSCFASLYPQYWCCAVVCVLGIKYTTLLARRVYLYSILFLPHHRCFWPIPTAYVAHSWRYVPYSIIYCWCQNTGI